MSSSTGISTADSVLPHVYVAHTEDSQSSWWPPPSFTCHEQRWKKPGVLFHSL